MTSYERILALDTSTATMTVAIHSEEGIVAQKQTKAERNHSIYLVPSIIEALEQADMTMNELEAIVVGKGPGSYTGIRIGASVAKTLAWSLNIPLIGVSSLEAMAAGVIQHQEQCVENNHIQLVCPMMNARRGQVYTALYQMDASGTKKLLDDGVRLLADWLQQLSVWIPEKFGQQQQISLHFIGETTPFVDQLQAMQASANDWDVQYFEDSIQARWIAQLGLRALCDQQGEPIHTFAPNYTQLAEAEVKLRQRQQQER